MRRSIAFLMSSAIAALAVSPSAFACTDFRIETTGGDVVVGRSMEWGADLHSRLVTHPRGEAGKSTGPDGRPLVSWSGKNGYASVDANGLDVVVDGMNEKGLSMGLLWLPGYTQYQSVSADQMSSALSVTELGAWILANFDSCAEVKAALPKMRIWAPNVPSFGGLPTAHLALHDAHGDNIVVEFVGGEQKIYDNPAGILTNAPTFDWHMVNLKNYISLQAENIKPVKFNNTEVAAPGHGSGFFGMPGDWSPPSRFVRTAAIVHFSNKQDSVDGAVNLAGHILNAVDIPQGAIREVIGGQEYSDYTQWVVVKDLTNHRIYYRSYENLSPKVLDLSKLNLEAGAARTYTPISSAK
jgi:choloylglycine hydrolase